MAAGAVFLDSFVESSPVSSDRGIVLFDFYVDTFVKKGCECSRTEGSPVLALPIGYYEAAGAIFEVTHDRFSVGSTKADFDRCASIALLRLAFAPHGSTSEFCGGTVVEGSDEHRRRVEVGFYTRDLQGSSAQIFRLPAGDYSIGHHAFRIADVM
jgi:hypothetical protein